MSPPVYACDLCRARFLGAMGLVWHYAAAHPAPTWQPLPLVVRW